VEFENIYVILSHLFALLVLIKQLNFYSLLRSSIKPLDKINQLTAAYRVNGY